jgi:hypothetical protein
MSVWGRPGAVEPECAYPGWSGGGKEADWVGLFLAFWEG